MGRGDGACPHWRLQQHEEAFVEALPLTTTVSRHPGVNACGRPSGLCVRALSASLELCLLGQAAQGSSAVALAAPLGLLGPCACFHG